PRQRAPTVAVRHRGRSPLGAPTPLPNSPLRAPTPPRPAEHRSATRIGSPAGWSPSSSAPPAPAVRRDARSAFASRPPPRAERRWPRASRGPSARSPPARHPACVVAPPACRRPGPRDRWSPRRPCSERRSGCPYPRRTRAVRWATGVAAVAGRPKRFPSGSPGVATVPARRRHGVGCRGLLWYYRRQIAQPGEAGGSDAVHFGELVDRAEAAVGRAPGQDGAGGDRADAGQVVEFLLGGGVEVHLRRGAGLCAGPGARAGTGGADGRAPRRAGSVRCRADHDLVAVPDALGEVEAGQVGAFACPS